MFNFRMGIGIVKTKKIQSTHISHDTKMYNRLWEISKVMAKKAEINE